MPAPFNLQNTMHYDFIPAPEVTPVWNPGSVAMYDQASGCCMLLVAGPAPLTYAAPSVNANLESSSTSQTVETNSVVEVHSWKNYSEQRFWKVFTGACSHRFHSGRARDDAKLAGTFMAACEPSNNCSNLIHHFADSQEADAALQQGQVQKDDGIVIYNTNSRETQFFKSFGSFSPEDNEELRESFASGEEHKRLRLKTDARMKRPLEVKWKSMRWSRTKTQKEALEDWGELRFKGPYQELLQRRRDNSQVQLESSEECPRDRYSSASSRTASTSTTSWADVTDGDERVQALEQQ